jgi:bifunctional DNase/RNase
VDVVVTLSTITLDPRDTRAVAILLHAASGRCLPLWLADVDAAALAAAWRGERSTASSSSALVMAVLQACGGALDRVELRVSGGVVRAALVVVGAAGVVVLAARASTAIGAAMLVGAPVVVDDLQLGQIHGRLQEAAARVAADRDGVDEPEKLSTTERWNQLLQHLGTRLVDELPS